MQSDFQRRLDVPLHSRASRGLMTIVVVTAPQLVAVRFHWTGRRQESARDK